MLFPSSFAPMLDTTSYLGSGEPHWVCFNSNLFYYDNSRHQLYATTYCQLDTPLTVEVEAHSLCHSLKFGLSFFRDPCEDWGVQNGLYEVILTSELVEQVFHDCFYLVVSGGSGLFRAGQCRSGPGSPPIHHIEDTGYTSIFPTQWLLHRQLGEMSWDILDVLKMSWIFLRHLECLKMSQDIRNVKASWDILRHLEMSWEILRHLKTYKEKKGLKTFSLVY